MTTQNQKNIDQAQEIFRERIKAVTQKIAGKTVDNELDTWLNENLGPQTQIFKDIKASCLEGVEQGWLCNREGGGIKYGRIFKPADDLNGFSVDVVDMKDIAGPHHAHPQGEIDLIMPIDSNAKFDGRPEGWLVYPPASAHRPTVSEGRAYVLYLLPQGAIEFTK